MKSSIITTSAFALMLGLAAAQAQTTGTANGGATAGVSAPGAAATGSTSTSATTGAAGGNGTIAPPAKTGVAGAASGSGTIQSEHPNLGAGPAGTIQNQTAIGTRGTAGLAGTSTAPLPGVGSVQENMNATANSTLNVTTGLPGQTSTGGLTSVTDPNGTTATTGTTGNTTGYTGTAPIAPSYGLSGSVSGQSTGVIPPNMSQTQFSTYATQSWDTNSDGMISVPEWTAANRTWFGPKVTLSDFRTWDRNRNGQLDATEVNNFFTRSNLYASYDVDGNGVIDQSEAARIPVR